MSTPSNNLLERVRKLLAQAEDHAATAAESEAFNAKAAELIARYGIETALLAYTGATRDEITQRSVIVHNPYRRDKAHLLTCIASALRCRTVHYAHRVEVFGFVSDLQRVEILFTSLLVQATTQLLDVRPDNYHGHESTAAYRRSWLAGFTTAVYQRLTKAERAAAEHVPDPESGAGSRMAVVLADRTSQVDTAFERTYPRLKTMRSRQLSGSGQSDGYHAGTRANLGSTRLSHARSAIGG